jgi:hypothetical protein
MPEGIEWLSKAFVGLAIRPKARFSAAEEGRQAPESTKRQMTPKIWILSSQVRFNFLEFQI